MCVCVCMCVSEDSGITVVGKCNQIVGSGQELSFSAS